MATVIVFNNNIEKALRKFKKTVANNGTLQEVKDRQHFEKPSAIRRRKKACAKMRWKKKQRESGDYQEPKKF